MGLNRRGFLSGAASLLTVPGVLFARADTERRFVFIIQRGAADGLHTVVPYAEPAYARLRGALALDAAETLKLDGTFALHPALAGLHRLHAAGQASFVHAVASPYRDRSHFDGQNVLETGGSAPYRLKDGWMNRLVGLLPPAGGKPIAFAPAVPLALRGAHEVTSYAPSGLPQAGDDLLLRVGQLYARDAQLHGLWSSALEARGMAGGMGDVSGERAHRQAPAALGRMAAGFLARADGPRIALIETSGWDTHSAQRERLAAQLQGLDDLIEGLHQALGAVWTHTVVLVATEFGRTVAVNGTAGTDHGTGAVAMLLGGLVQGGRVVSDWPGLAAAHLLDGRDLRPTLGLDALIARTCAELYGLEPEHAARVLFPELAAGPFPAGLLRA
jgi:uncharacterized protein (DUF1501 family)